MSHFACVSEVYSHITDATVSMNHDGSDRDNSRSTEDKKMEVYVRSRRLYERVLTEGNKKRGAAVAARMRIEKEESCVGTTSRLKRQECSTTSNAVHHIVRKSRLVYYLWILVISSVYECSSNNVVIGSNASMYNTTEAEVEAEAVVPVAMHMNAYGWNESNSSAFGNTQRSYFEDVEDEVVEPPSIPVGTAASMMVSVDMLQYMNNVNQTGGAFAPEVIESVRPSVSPSFAVTDSPTASPTAIYMSDFPTLYNTSSPSMQFTVIPSSVPTWSPSVMPTPVVITSIVRQMFSQTYSGRSLNQMEEDQILGYQVILTLQTQNYGPSGGEPNVTTKCLATNQELSYSRRLLQSLLYSIKKTLQRSRSMQLSDNAAFVDASLRYLEVDFEMLWTSNSTNLTDPSYVTAFVTYMNSESGKISTKEQLINLGVAVEVVDNVRLQVPSTTPSPTVSMAPSATKVPVPTESVQPSSYPIIFPSPTTPSSTSRVVIGIVSTVVALSVIFLAAVIIQRRSQKRGPTPSMGHTSLHSTPNPHTNQRSVVPRHTSSNHSLISEAHSLSSESMPDHHDATHIIHQYNQNAMETTLKMNDTSPNDDPNNVIMNHPFDDEDILSSYVDDFKWGSVAGDPPEVVEVSVLCETNYWLKKKEGATIEERRLFLLEAMNKMLKSVQHIIISDDDATRTIHNCAAMLGLSNVNIEEDIPETALIITGMRKTVTADDVQLAFQEFGDILHAAVAPKSRGFGLVRYTSPKSVQRAMDKFRKEEVVVQDVAVVVRVLSSTMNTIDDKTPTIVDPPPTSSALGTIGPAMGNSLGRPTQPIRQQTHPSINTHSNPNINTHSRHPSSAGSSSKSSRSGLPPVVPHSNN